MTLRHGSASDDENARLAQMIEALDQRALQANNRAEAGNDFLAQMNSSLRDLAR